MRRMRKHLLYGALVLSVACRDNIFWTYDQSKCYSRCVITKSKRITSTSILKSQASVDSQGISYNRFSAAVPFRALFLIFWQGFFSLTLPSLAALGM